MVRLLAHVCVSQQVHVKAALGLSEHWGHTTSHFLHEATTHSSYCSLRINLSLPRRWTGKCNISLWPWLKKTLALCYSWRPHLGGTFSLKNHEIDAKNRTVPSESVGWLFWHLVRVILFSGLLMKYLQMLSYEQRIPLLFCVVIQRGALKKASLTEGDLRSNKEKMIEENVSADDMWNKMCPHTHMIGSQLLVIGSKSWGFLLI